MDVSQTKVQKTRKPYIKPGVVRVSLVAEEAVLATGCKVPARLSTAIGQTAIGCGNTHCSSDGS